MTTRRTIDAKDIVRDIRSHMTDVQLMDKYTLSAQGLQSVLKKLLETRLINQSEYGWRPGGYEDTVTLNLDFLPKER